MIKYLVSPVFLINGNCVLSIGKNKPEKYRKEADRNAVSDWNINALKNA